MHGREIGKGYSWERPRHPHALPQRRCCFSVFRQDGLREWAGSGPTPTDWVPRGAHRGLQQMHSSVQLGSLAESRRTATRDQVCSRASASPCARSWRQGCSPDLAIVSSGSLQIRRSVQPSRLPGFI